MMVDLEIIFQKSVLTQFLRLQSSSTIEIHIQRRQEAPRSAPGRRALGVCDLDDRDGHAAPGKDLHGGQRLRAPPRRPARAL